MKKIKVKYLVCLSYYKSGSGYSHTEEFENDVMEIDSIDSYTAEDWLKDFNDNQDDEECMLVASDNGDWIDIELKLYDIDDDPMFDEPLSVTSYTI